MTDKIQDELEKGCGKMISPNYNKNICGSISTKNDRKFKGIRTYCYYCKLKLSQHLATKQAMINLIDENYIDFFKHHLNCEFEGRKMIEMLEELKQKLGELK